MIKFAELKKFFIYCLIGSLIVAAAVAVVTVLIGEYNDITGKAFATLFMVTLHSLISLSFIWEDSRNNTFDRFTIFINTIFLIIVASFVASIFHIWDIIPTKVLAHIYTTFFFVGFASLHADILSKASGKEKYMDMIIYANYLCITIVVLMLQPIIYLDNPETVLGSLYYRFVAAVGIIDGTLSILTIIFYKLYMHKHPKAVSELETMTEGKKPKKRLSIWVWILIIYLVFQILVPMIALMGGAFASIH